jgi:hypothetical protein
MNFHKNGITLSVSEVELRRLVLERLNDSEILLPPESATLDPPPRIGEEWTAQGGFYAGIARGRDGKPDYHLIVGPEHATGLPWQDASSWASTVMADGYSDYTLPTRKEQALCFANVPELFKDETYWSSEQHASYSDYAWDQGFDNGTQSYWDKFNKLRARAVRRLPIR